MSDWYVYQHDGDPLGPWSTETVANAILSGNLAADVWVAAPGGSKWLRALDVPVIGALVDGIPTVPRRRESGLRVIPGAFKTENGMPAFGSTMMIVKDGERDSSPITPLDVAASSSAQTTRAPTTRALTTRALTTHAAPSADDTARIYGLAAFEDALATEPALPPSSSDPTPEPPTPVKAPVEHHRSRTKASRQR